MQLPLQITFRGLDPAPAIEADIREKVAKLDQYYDHIMSCRVMVEAPHRHQRHGKIYHVRVDLKVPDAELVASRDAPEHQAHEDVYVAIRDAFASVQRQLENYVRRRRGNVKSHEVPGHGRVMEVYPEQDYGVIEDAQGREIYFHRNSVLEGSFDLLTAGADVRFAEEAGDKGPQASSVRPVGKHHLHS